MRAFIDTEVSKPELLKTLAWYREEDRLRQGGAYWKGGRGCAVGCTLHEFATGEEDLHVLYEELFGIPEELARLEDAIFEGLHPEAARTWPERFVGSIPEGADLECVADESALWILGGEDSPMAAWRDSEYLQPTLELYRRHLGGLPSRRGDWTAAAKVAEGGLAWRQPVRWTATRRGRQPTGIETGTTGSWLKRRLTLRPCTSRHRGPRGRPAHPPDSRQTGRGCRPGS